MDLNEQVARRRAEMKRQGERVATEARDAENARKAAEKVQRQVAVEAVAAELRTSGLPVRRDGEDLAIEPAPPPPIDVAALKQTKVAALLDREVRRLWTPGDNWFVISCIAAGIALIHLAGIGIVVLAAGLWRRSVIDKRYRAQVLAIYPQLAPTTR